MRIPKKALLLAVQRGVNVVDAFSTDLYTGNGSTQTITNGIDLAGEGGLVWIKSRSLSENHTLQDTIRGGNTYLRTNLTLAEATNSSFNFSFNSDGFSQNNSFGGLNSSGETLASWTFRQAPKFFDIVQYTGDGFAGRQIAHDLGVAPGMITTKSLSTTGDWNTYHRSATGDVNLNTTAAQTASRAIVTAASDSTFTVSGVANSSGVTYIAYLFAHDPSDSGIIQCGSYVGNGSTNGPVIDLGWQPQWVLFKRSDLSGDWFIHDNKRDTTNPRTAYLEPNTADIETAGRDIDFTTTGFQLKTADANVNVNNGTYIYCAIAAPE